MNKMSKKVALVLSATLAVSAMGVTAFADDYNKDAEAGIKFEKSDVEIIDPPEDLKDISSTDIYFGKNKTSARTQYIQSTAAPGYEKGDKAGFVVSDPNGDGWEVKVAISAFNDEDDDAILGEFFLELTPETPKTTNDNTGAKAPVAKKVTNLAPNTTTGGLGTQLTIFTADANNGEGVGVWGCNWAGELTVLPGAASEGDGTAVMKWSLEVTPRP